MFLMFLELLIGFVFVLSSASLVKAIAGKETDYSDFKDFATTITVVATILFFYWVIS